MANQLQEACCLVEKSLAALFKSPSAEFFEIADLIQSVSLHKLPKEVKQRTLFYCAVAGVFKALHLGLFNILLQFN